MTIRKRVWDYDHMGVTVRTLRDGGWDLSRFDSDDLMLAYRIFRGESIPKFTEKQQIRCSELALENARENWPQPNHAQPKQKRYR